MVDTLETLPPLELLTVVLVNDKTEKELQKKLLFS